MRHRGVAAYSLVGTYNLFAVSLLIVIVVAAYSLVGIDNLFLLLLPHESFRVACTTFSTILRILSVVI